MKHILIIYCLLFICSSCAEKVQQKEYFDVVTIEEFENRYNSKEKLEAITITSKQVMYDLATLMSLKMNMSFHQYTYRHDSLYSICKTTGVDKDMVTTTYYRDKSKETITIRNNKDTIEYSLYQYKDYKEEKLDYERIIRRFTGEPIINFTVNDNYEERYFYDKERVIKIVRHDFNNNETEETYYFNGIPYKEALQAIPKSSNKQRIVCHTSHNINDTLIEKSFINGELNQVVKKYRDNDKKIEHTCAADGYEVFHIQYKEKDLDITVESSTFMGNRIDSTYRRNGKTIREAHITDESRCLVTYAYDSRGNLTKRVTKTKFFK